MQPKIVVGPGGTPFPVLDDGAIPHANGKNGKNGKADIGPVVSILPGTAYTPEAVRWLWDGWLARGKLRPPSHDHIEPRSRGGTLAAGNRAVVCFPCNRDKGSRSLGRWVYRLCRAGDPRAAIVAAFALRRGVELGFLDTDPLHAFSLRGVYPLASP